MTSNENSKKIVSVPYAHRIAPNLKNVGNRYGLELVFSAPNKLSKICSKLDRKVSIAVNTNAGSCTVNHTTKFVKCSLSVVYCLPLTCGKVYIGQTGRCLNTRLLEHKRSLGTDIHSHIKRHCSQCGCSPLYSDTTVVFRHGNQLTREIVEAFHIKKRKEGCISQSSVSLSNREASYLEGLN